MDYDNIPDMIRLFHGPLTEEERAANAVIAAKVYAIIEFQRSCYGEQEPTPTEKLN